MIPLEVNQLLLKYFDSIDAFMGKPMMRKRPWNEISLTSLLCDLLDSDSQADYKLEYIFDELIADIKKCGIPVELNCTLETHEYTSQVERHITQSDIGFVIKFDDHVVQENSWESSYLLQCKRLKPDSKLPKLYNQNSKFNFNEEQKERLSILEDKINIKFIRYLLYCPKTTYLDENTFKILSAWRNDSITTIQKGWDYVFYLSKLLHKMIHALDASMYVVDTNDLPQKLVDVHKNVLQSNLPLSWFVIQHFLSEHLQGHFDKRLPIWCKTKNPLSKDYQDYKLVNNIVRGRKQEAISELRKRDLNILDWNFSFFPSHTITINVSIGPT